MSSGALDIQNSNCVQDIGEAGWNNFTGGRPFTSYQWYRYGERVMADSAPLYISVSQHGELIARASFYLVRNEPLPIYSSVVRRVLRPFFNARPLLICRSPLADQDGMILPPQEPLRKMALDAILETARAFAHQARASFLVCDYLSAAQAAMPIWPDGWIPVNIGDPSTCLPLACDSFDAYLAGMSKSMRKDYRRHLNQADRLNLEVTASPQVTDIDAALPLIRAVERQHQSAAKPWARAMLENAHMLPSTWITARIDKRLVGCGLLLADHGVQIATLLGLDYSYSYVYFQVVYQAIRQAIQQGAHLLRGGSGAYDLKQRLGFVIEENNSLRFAGQGRFLSWAIPQLIGSRWL